MIYYIYIITSGRGHLLYKGHPEGVLIEKFHCTYVFEDLGHHFETKKKTSFAGCNNVCIPMRGTKFQSAHIRWVRFCPHEFSFYPDPQLNYRNSGNNYSDI